jgi:hypothetical protein
MYNENRKLPIKRLMLLILVLVINTNTIQLNSDEQRKNDIKAAMIYKFIKFIDWSMESINALDNPFCIGLLGEDPIKDFLYELEKFTVKGRKIEIKIYSSVEEFGFCHVLYISSLMKKDLEEIVTLLRGRSVLTIGNVNEFENHGLIINLVLQNDKFKFYINLECARQNNLYISSKLLNLAQIGRYCE